MIFVNDFVRRLDCKIFYYIGLGLKLSLIWSLVIRLFLVVYFFLGFGLFEVW